MSSIFLYNSLTRQIQSFVPLDPTHIKIYSCGPTVYWEPHIGNMRYFFVCGLLRDILEHVCGYPKITHVMNITDVGHLVSDGDDGEDKMQKGARREAMTAREVAQRYTDRFMDILDKLHIHFEYNPKATDHIWEQIRMIEILEQKWYTYIVPQDGVYFDTSKMADYGVLTTRENLAWLQAWQRVDLWGKKNATDFALWKFNLTGKRRDMERDSPRWVWFPWWHIECSAMSRKYLGDHFDIHTGGVDHIPVHHTNEIAQSECSDCFKPRVNYRLHSQFLNSEGKKISKSLGNGYVMQDIIDRGYSPEDLRMFFLKAHYRSFQDFTREALEEAKKNKMRLRLLTDEEELQIDRSVFVNDLCDDLNTAKLISTVLHTGVPRWLDEKIFKLGLSERNRQTPIPSAIQDLANLRWKAKLDKNWSEADRLREELKWQWRDMLDGKDSYELKKW